MIEFLPLVAALLLAVVVLVTPASRRLDRALTRVSYAVFRGAAVDGDARRARDLRAAAIGTPYRVYVTRTRLYAAVGALVGSVVGVYVAAALLSVLSVASLSVPGGETLARLPEILRTDAVKRFVVYLFAAFSFGGLVATSVYALRWELPSMRASARRRQIDAALPRIVAFVYALSRGGMAFPDVMRALARQRGVFGAGAEDVGVGVRDIDLFGADVITSVRRISQRTPSEGFQQFTENLANVLQSGRDLSAFLNEQYERHREQALEQQRDVLDLLATTAEMYVTVVVAGMLFLITILMVIGLTTGGTLGLVRLLTYVVLPVINLVFVAYLAEATQPLRATRERDPDPALDDTTHAGTRRRDRAEWADATVADGGLDAAVDSRSGPVTERRRVTLERLRAHRRFGRARAALRSPVTAVASTPELLFVVTVPLAAGFVLWRVVGAGLVPATLDDPLVLATLFVLGTYAVVHEARRRRHRRIEAAVPDLLERLASLNEAGVSIVSSFERARGADLGALDAQVERIWRDVQWGATVERALTDFERRIRTPAITRTVTLITSAMAASNEIGPVLRIAAEQARADRRLRRQRRQEMFTYLIVVYVAFVVFLIVIAAIDAVLIPSLPSADRLSTAGGAFVGVGARNVEAYRLVFYHAALLQAGLSGLVAGQMASASIRDGVKHAVIMLAVAYVALLVL